MNILYLVNINENNRKGLFTATHEKLKIIINSKDINNCKIYAINFYDIGLMKLIKKISKKQIRTKGVDSFVYDGIEYKKIYIGVGIINKILEKLNLDILNFLPMLIKYKKEIKQYDLVSCHWGYPHGRIAYYIKKLYNLPYIVTYHGSDIHTMPVKDSSIRKKVIEILNNASKNIFISKKLYEASKVIGYNNKNYIISKNGVNIDNFYKLDDDKISTIKKELNLNKIVIGFTGNLNHIKRADKLVEIFKNIKNILNTDDISFLIIGDGPLIKQIENGGANNNLNIHITGNVFVDDVRKYINTMDIMVLPSRNEGFGCVILEANACGVPVVATNVGGIPEAIEDNNMLVDDGEDFEERFSNKVCEILNLKYSSEDLIKRVKDNFTWEAVSKDEINVYKGEMYE